MMQDVLRLFARILRIQRHEHRADPGHRERGEKKFAAVRQQERHPVALFYADSKQRPGHLFDFVLELVVTPATVLEDQCQAIRMFFRASGEKLGECRWG
jgi:hypothetical protein